MEKILIKRKVTVEKKGEKEKDTDTSDKNIYSFWNTGGRLVAIMLGSCVPQQLQLKLL